MDSAGSADRGSKHLEIAVFETKGLYIWLTGDTSRMPVMLRIEN